MEIFAYYSPSDKMIYSAAEVDAMTGDTSEFIPMTWDDYELVSNPPDGKMVIWVDGKLTVVDLPPQNWVGINTAIAESLKDSAMATVQVLITKLNMGRTLTAAEKAKVNAVLDYCDAVDAVDLTVEEPDWPELPNT